MSFLITRLSVVWRQICCLSALAFFSAAQGAEVKLAWDANQETNLAGYNVYVVDSGATNKVNAGNVTTFTVPNLRSGAQYSFFVTAYNTAGDESGPSEVLSHTITSAPLITGNPESSSVKAGASVAFQVQATGTAPFTYQWLKNGQPIAGATSATYQIASVSISDAGSYSVQVSNSAGSERSDEAQLTVIPALALPSITKHPISQTALARSVVVLQVAASGESLSFQWTKDGAELPGANTATLMLPSVVATDAGVYQVNVWNEAGSVTSLPATVSVITPPTITAHPGSLNLIKGAPLSLSVAAVGTAPFNYQWFLNDSPISGANSAIYTVGSVSANDAGRYRVQVSNLAGSVSSLEATVTVAGQPTITAQPESVNLIDGGQLLLSVTVAGTAPFTYQWFFNDSPISGANSEIYAVETVSPNHAGRYHVQVSNQAGSVTSLGATVTVTTPPTITAQPESLNLIDGAQLLLAVSATGSAPLTYQWFHNDSPIDGANSEIYALEAVSPGDAGRYQVQVSNQAGSVTSLAATVTVTTPPTITAHPESVRLINGGQLTLSVAASGTAPFTYQWFHNDSPISGANSATYSVGAVNPNAAGRYRVQVSNAAGSVTSLNATVEVTSAPIITTQPESFNLFDGEQLLLAVTATGTSPLKYQWFHNDSPITGANSANFTIETVSTNDAGRYQVQVSNEAGSVTSIFSIITVITPPAITTQPESLNLINGGALSLSVEAAGTAPFTYQWFRNDSPINGATSATYAVAAVSTNDAGNYRVQVSNPAGSISSATAAVTVLVSSGNTGGGGTNENPAVEIPEISTRILGNGAVQLFGVGIPGRQYEILATREFRKPYWFVLAKVTAGPDGLFRTTASGDALGSTGFFMVRLVP